MSTPLQITTLAELAKAADDRKAVVVPNDRCWNRPRPAMFVLNLSGAILFRLFNSGMFIYTKTK